MIQVSVKVVDFFNWFQGFQSIKSTFISRKIQASHLVVSSIVLINIKTLFLWLGYKPTSVTHKQVKRDEVVLFDNVKKYNQRPGNYCCYLFVSVSSNLILNHGYCSQAVTVIGSVNLWNCLFGDCRIKIGEGRQLEHMRLLSYLPCYTQLQGRADSHQFRATYCVYFCPLRGSWCSGRLNHIVRLSRNNAVFPTSSYSQNARIMVIIAE